MKKTLLQLVAFLLISIGCFAQNEIQLNINHKLAESDFGLKTKTTNNIEHNFEITRLQYYISEISVIHDGGTQTKIDDVWILVDASKETSVNLGSHDINEVEKLVFSIGVDRASNHKDPASFKSSHPLSPKSPSMHWGWNPGYRFVAIEGHGGNKLNQLFELHGLGDKNYFQSEIAISTTAKDGKLPINIDADYTRVLEDISVNSGVIVHGDNLEAKKALENFRDYVFSAAAEETANVDFSEIISFSIFPNPTSNGHTSLLINSAKSLNYEVSITNILGREIAHVNTVNSNNAVDLKLSDSGFYFVNLIKEGQTIISKKLIVR